MIDQDEQSQEDFLEQLKGLHTRGERLAALAVIASQTLHVPPSFTEVINFLLDSGSVTEQLLCRRFVITPRGLAKWKDGTYVPHPTTHRRIYQLIFEELKKVS